jgi:hypothetical protein
LIFVPRLTKVFEGPASSCLCDGGPKFVKALLLIKVELPSPFVDKIYDKLLLPVID